MGPLAFFVYLQLLDFLTTLLFLRLGLREAGWVTGALMRHGPLLGLVGAKLAAVLIAVTAVHYQKGRALRWANLGYCGVVVWNLVAMIAARPA
jgi:hypothetical protein